MRKTKMQKGITLIALIITIVVILILAAVTISVLSDSGIISRAKNAQTEYEIAKLKEQIELQKAEIKLEEYGSEITVKDVLEKFGEESTESISIASNAKSIPENMPAGEYYIITPEKYASNNVEVRRYAKLTSRGDIRENDILKDVYVINEQLDIYYIIEASLSLSGDDVTSPEIGEEDNKPEEISKATVGIKVTKNSTIDGQAYSSINPIIPVGFTAINTGTSAWDSVSGPEVDNGLVIRDESGNEFVWVPVTTDIDVNGYGLNTRSDREPDVVTGVYPSDTVDSASGTSRDAVLSNLQRAGCTEDLNNDGTVNAYDFKIQLTNEYKVMAESVNKYKGFYVGRFETSRNGANPQSRRSTYVSGSGEKIITAYNSSTENDWYGLYALNKKYITDSVQGSMMWGIQYNKMMTWMGDAANATISGYNKNRTCGTAENDVINNVYDVYGNSSEWTVEVNAYNDRASRGGNYSYNGAPIYSHNNRPCVPGGGYGSRIALYVL